MGFSSLAECVAHLEKCGELIRCDCEIDPKFVLPSVQRRAFANEAPAILFTNVKGTEFPVLANLFGTRKRLGILFEDSLRSVESILALKADINFLFKDPLSVFPASLGLIHMLIQKVTDAPVLECQTTKEKLPHIVSWPKDGGAFITLPIVYSEDITKENRVASANLGMYRIQLNGNDYTENECGLHYQLHRGIGSHHKKALEAGKNLSVYIYVGGPPSLTISSIMPLPENVSELRFAGLLGGRNCRVSYKKNLPMPVIADADFCIVGHIGQETKPEGPFGDHVGYYSLKHDFPVMHIDKIYHRKDAIWPFTSVARPPQEDTVFGDFIHELTSPLITTVFNGISEVHAVDCAGVHPLLLAIGSERYTPYEKKDKPREILTQALHLLGTTQTSLAKYLLIVANDIKANLSTRKVKEFFKYVLERTDFSRDLHFLTKFTADTLDYTDSVLHEGSKLIWAVCGEKLRELGMELHDFPDLPSQFSDAGIVNQGILAIKGEKHNLENGQCDPVMIELAKTMGNFKNREQFPLVVVVDDLNYVREKFEDFLWVTFTRSNPATDIYGAHANMHARHWMCESPLIIDARIKPFHPEVLEEDQEAVKKAEALAAPGGPLFGLI